jgi:hypothetical protein
LLWVWWPLLLLLLLLLGLLSWRAVVLLELLFTQECLEHCCCCAVLWHLHSNAKTQHADNCCGSMSEGLPPSCGDNAEVTPTVASVAHSLLYEV